MPSSSRRRPNARWIVPLGAAVAIVLGSVVVPMIAGAAPSLPPRSAADLLAAVTSATDQPFAGTVVETARLGLPALPAVERGDTSPASLLTGSQTAQVWYADEDTFRIALVGTLAETDFVRDGSDAWLWSSDSNSAERLVRPGHLPKATVPDPPAGALTPLRAAEQALAAVDPTTAVSVDGTAEVAGRDAYELVLRPRDERSLVSAVRLAIDAETDVPLRVRILAEGKREPAFETGFTSVRFERPADSVFRFSPPPGAKVTTRRLADPGAAGSADEVLTDSPLRLGQGWTTVVEVPAAQAGELRGSELGHALFRDAKRVSGRFGDGALLTGTLSSVLLTDDGRLFVGAVTPEALLAAADTMADTKADTKADAKADTKADTKGRR
jgi:outer membrane lipoprotein-sorting protein